MTTTVTAAVAREHGSPFSIEQLELDSPRPDEVLVKIAAAGLCHTDLRVLEGTMPLRLPAVVGHEGTGVVEEVGSNVTGLAPGDHVVLSFDWCGHCVACLEGRPTQCQSMFPLNFGGARPDGTPTMTTPDGASVCGHFMGQSSFATYALTPAHSAIKIPADLDLTVMAALACTAQTGAGAVLNTLKVNAGDSVIVSGVGAVGLAAVMAAHAVGATRIVAVDLLPERLDAALDLGATHVVNGGDDDVVAQIQRAIGGPADFAVDTTGVPDVVHNDALAVRAGGQLGLIASGLDSTGRRGLAVTGKTVHFVLAGNTLPSVFIPRLIDLYTQGRFPIDRLISAYKLEDIETGIADAEAGRATKVVFTMQ